MQEDTLARPRAVVLVTGMSGTGKSTVSEALQQRGHAVVDTDDPGWMIEAPIGSEPKWDLGRVRELLEHHQDGWLFIGGCVADQGVMYERFDAVVLLSAPVDVLLERVAHRTNPFGSTAADRDRIASDHDAFEPVLRAGAGHEIVTTVAVARVVNEIERIAESVGVAARNGSDG